MASEAGSASIADGQGRVANVTNGLIGADASRVLPDSGGRLGRRRKHAIGIHHLRLRPRTNVLDFKAVIHQQVLGHERLSVGEGVEAKAALYFAVGQVGVIFPQFGRFGGRFLILRRFRYGYVYARREAGEKSALIVQQVWSSYKNEKSKTTSE